MMQCACVRYVTTIYNTASTVIVKIVYMNKLQGDGCN